MVRHIVWWTLKEHAEGRSASENALRLQQASAMLHGLSSLRSLEVSCNIQTSTTVPAQVVLTSTHEDMAALAAYANDPVHLQFARLVQAVSSSRNCIDYIIA